MTYRHLPGALLVFSLLVVCACSSDSDAELGDATHPAADGGKTESLYDPEHVLEVELRVADADWQLVRSEGRTLREIFGGCPDTFEYTLVPAQLTLDGKKIGKVGLRKKGYLGSLSVLRPSLHVDVSEYSKDLRALGAKTLVLNNSRQDSSFTHTCMAYAVFAKAGLPAPRCSFARVTVNGEALGTYVNVEAIKKPFLADHFGDDSGNLWEGTGGADFRSDMLDGFEQKTNESTPTHAALDAVIATLAKSGDARNAALEKLIDMDGFYEFWAVESLVSHWDGYSGDLNNFFLYERPSDHELVFMPWGPDAAFVKDHAFLPEIGRPLSVLALAHLPRLLYDEPSSRERYRKTLRGLLDDVWDEDALLAEVDRIAAIAGDEASAKLLDAQRDFIRGRRAELDSELDMEPAPKWTFDERAAKVCVKDVTTPASGTFKAKWGDINAAVADPNASLTLTLDGKAQKLTKLTVSAGEFTDAASGIATPTVRMVGARADGSFLVVQIALGKRTLKDAQRIPMLGLESFGIVLTGTTPANLKTVALISDGAVTLEHAGMNDGDEVSGTFDGEAVPFTP